MSDAIVQVVLVIVLIVAILTVAAHYWEVSTALMVFGLIIWARSRVWWMPEELPRRLRERATKTADFIPILAPLIQGYAHKQAASSSMASAQQAQAPTWEGLEDLIRRKFSGTLLHVRGTIREVQMWEKSMEIELVPDDRGTMSPGEVRIFFPKRWMKALSDLKESDHIEVIGALINFSHGERIFMDGRPLLVGDVGIDDTGECEDPTCLRLKGKTIASCSASLNAAMVASG